MFDDRSTVIWLLMLDSFSLFFFISFNLTLVEHNYLYTSVALLMINELFV